MAKYVLIVDFQPGIDETPMEEWLPEEVEAHTAHYRAINRELLATGELVQTEILTVPDLAKVGTSDGITVLLERMTHNPVVTVNRAVAAAMVDGPAAGLTILDGLDGSMAGSHRVGPRSERICSSWPATPTERSRTIGPPPA